MQKARRFQPNIMRTERPGLFVQQDVFCESRLLNPFSSDLCAYGSCQLLYSYVGMYWSRHELQCVCFSESLCKHICYPGLVLQREIVSSRVYAERPMVRGESI